MVLKSGERSDGLDEENFSAMSSNFLLSYNLAGIQSPNTFKIDFDAKSILPKRISLLIGRNGLGKSQALHTIATSLIKGGKSFQDRVHGRPFISRLVAIAAPGDASKTFPIQNKHSQIKYRRISQNMTGRHIRDRGFGNVCVQLVRSEDKIGRSTRWGIFKESISLLQDFEDLVIPIASGMFGRSIRSPNVIEINGKNYFPLLKLGSCSEQENLEIFSAIISNRDPLRHIDGGVFPLSSGQLAFIKFVLQACTFIENGTLILIDEPEIHLHPNFISEYVRILNKLLSLTGSFAIIATHSVYFVREVPKTQVHVFRESKDGNSVDIIPPTLKTFGADVGALSYFVFEDEITNGLIEDLISAFHHSSIPYSQLLKTLESELSAEVIMYLRRKLNIGDDNETD